MLRKADQHSCQVIYQTRSNTVVSIKGFCGTEEDTKHGAAVIYIHCVSKKRSAELTTWKQAVTLANLNGFSKFFH